MVKTPKKEKFCFQFSPILIERYLFLACLKMDIRNDGRLLNTWFIGANFCHVNPCAKSLGTTALPLI